MGFSPLSLFFVQQNDQSSGQLALQEVRRGIQRLEDFSNANVISAVKILKKLDKNLNVEVKDVYVEEVLKVQSFHPGQVMSIRMLEDKLKKLVGEETEGTEKATVEKREKTASRMDADARRDLNNDLAASDSTSMLTLCVPLRRNAGTLEVMTVCQNSGPLKLVTTSIEAGESSDDGKSIPKYSHHRGDSRLGDRS